MVLAILALCSKRFPDLQQLDLAHCCYVDDTAMQVVGMCAQLSVLRICHLSSLTPVGLVAVCQRLPRLRQVLCQDCSKLNKRALREVRHMLHKCGLLIEVKYVRWRF